MHHLYPARLLVLPPCTPALYSRHESGDNIENTVMTLASGIEVPVARIAEICKRYGIQELSIFGSAARGDMRADSDVDVPG